MKTVYLARKGEVFGPYSAPEYEAMKASGELEKYTWIWDERSGEWSPLDDSPPALSSAPPSAASKSTPPPAKPALSKPPAPSPPAPKKSTVMAFALGDLESLATICFTDEIATPGKITDATSVGCAFVTIAPRTAPKFGARAKVKLSLLDPKSSKMDIVAATIVGREHTAQGWIYQIRWQ